MSVKEYPVDEMGDMSEYAFNGSEMAPIVEFEATMKFIRVDRGDSSLRISVIDDKGKHWSIFGKHINEFIKHSKGGTLKGMWKMAKRGNYYGLDLVCAL